MYYNDVPIRYTPETIESLSERGFVPSSTKQPKDDGFVNQIANKLQYTHLNKHEDYEENEDDDEEDELIEKPKIGAKIREQILKQSKLISKAKKRVLGAKVGPLPRGTRSTSYN